MLYAIVKPRGVSTAPDIQPRPTERDLADTLGCVVVRRVIDDAGREWRVRQFGTAVGAGLFFRCEVPGVRPEIRPACGFLEALSDADLLTLLETGAE
jgi:hypothetical protein